MRPSLELASLEAMLVEEWLEVGTKFTRHISGASSLREQ